MYYLLPVPCRWAQGRYNPRHFPDSRSCLRPSNPDPRPGCRAASATAAPAEIMAEQAMLATIRRVYESYGFEPLETPAFEYTDALGKFLPDVDRPNEGVFSLKDDDDQWLSLRYDLTAPLARHVAANFQYPAQAVPPLPDRQRVAQRKAGAGALPRIHPVRCRHGGIANPAADAELLMMLSDTLEALGLARGDYIVKLNNRKLLDGVLEASGVALDDRDQARHRAARHRQDGPAGRGRRLRAAGRRPQGRKRRLHQGRRPDAGPGASHSGLRRARCEGRGRTSEPDRFPGGEKRGRRAGLAGTGSHRAAAAGLRLWPRPGDVRHRRGARAGLLHRRGVRGAADLPREE